MTEQERGSASDHITVVVADDHPMWRDAVARDLADAGFDVVATADDGRAAVARTRALVPDVLVLDLNLPGLDGPEVCTALSGAGVTDPHPHPLGERRPQGRARRRQGGRPRLPREVGRP